MHIFGVVVVVSVCSSLNYMSMSGTECVACKNISVAVLEAVFELWKENIVCVTKLCRYMWHIKYLSHVNCVVWNRGLKKIWRTLI